ncbi:biliverdin-producing heme oxygenase [Wielerella bovis]|uniref:biliverdin-producing heme oxygenase n=1 Tax=Wielerella bovis TaxID=2917790 RepID=UPI002018E707|nr:biliverdin-producing heme oxygenase [Wielerella bovis]ULJ60541.1 biliverdin-producing heme oxygenase [Wielerella bovis]ULJ62751.1 biliverdin-producing heme oxygenase [Wielerella bovis]ULJ64980.1 biliverdin-producing heme oxygenase [Wielerella bovis]ULJ67253.1 biliverdin-producing heme oxygenase [Wielerella bovis]ULJ69552.1 biliverdin-producing heme oxygenase [Wielerella bovis]
MFNHTNCDEKNENLDNLTLAKFLKYNCQTTHDSVDNLVMSVKPFDTPENYIRFLQLQAIFHKIVDDIYKNPDLNQKIEGLSELARYDSVIQDLQDLNTSEKAIKTPLPQLSGAEILGWLYCAEGSNVGAAFLFKDAQNKLGLGAEYGARHLAPHADGRGKHWRDFVAQLNTLSLTEEERTAALKGALDAFAFYKIIVREIFELK